MKKGIYWSILIISLLAGGLIYYATASGVWGFSDSVAYLVSARNFARGVGLGYAYPDGQIHLLTHYPPFFPLVLSIFYRLHLNALVMLRLLVIILYAVSISIAGLSIVRFTNSPELAIPVCLVLAVFPASVRIFSSAMSEPLFIFCWLCSTFLLLTYLHQPRPELFWGAAVVTSLVPFTRYVGVSFLAANCLAILLLERNSLWIRVKKVLGFGLVASAPTLLWLMWVAVNANQTFAGRTVILEWSTLIEKTRSFFGLIMLTIMNRLPLREVFALLPYRERWLLFGSGAAAIIILSWMAARRTSTQKEKEMNPSSLNVWLLFSLSAGCYLLGLLVAHLFTVPEPYVDERMLLPIAICLVLIIFSAFDLYLFAWFKERKKWFSIFPWLLAGLLVVSYWSTTWDLAARTRTAAGFLANYWRKSETIQALRSLPVELVLISNSPPAILFWADRPTYDVLETLRPEFLAQNNIYGSDLQDIAQQAFKKGGALVLFKSISLELNQAYGSDQYLSTLLQGLYLYGEYKDGAIYFSEPFFRVR